MQQKVPFIVAELGPDVDPFMLHIYAALAEKERADQRAHKGGAQGGKGEGRAPWQPALAEARASRMRANAEEAARQTALALPTIKPLHEQGQSLRAIARELEARGIPTARGGRWSAVQVADILRRATDCIGCLHAGVEAQPAKSGRHPPA